VSFVRTFAAVLVSVLVAYGVPAAAQVPGREGGGPPPAIPVEAQRVAIEPIVEKVQAIGTLRANRSVMVRPEIAGLVTEIGFTESGQVAKGAVLYRLDDAIVRAQLQQAEASLALSQRNHERAMSLYRKGAGTAQARDQAIAALDADRATVALARARLAQAVVHAPFAGIAGISTVDVGAYVTAGQDLVSLDDVDTVKIDFDVPERYARFIAKKEKVVVAADALPGRTFAGAVSVAATRIDPEARTLGVRARAPNPDHLLRPGMFARVSVEVGAVRRAIVIPEQAIVPQGDELAVFRVVNGKAARTVVVLGLREYGRAEIVKGLSPGDLVITAGQQKVHDGSPVTVIAASPAAAGVRMPRAASAAAIDPPAPAPEAGNRP
jgi:membrane fusion protein, multidrug efflux system